MIRYGLFLLWLLSFSAVAQVTVVASDSLGPGGSGTSVTLPSFAAGSTADAVFIICGTDWGLGDIVSGATYDGNSATAVGPAVVDNDNAIKMFYYAPGAASLTDTADAACNYTAATGYRCIGAVSVAGLDTANPVGTAGSNTSRTSPASITITDGRSGDLVIDGIYAWSQDITVGAGQTQQFKQDNIDGTVDCGGSTKPGGSSVIMQWTWSGTQATMAYQAVNINARVSSPSTVILRRRGR